MSMKKNRVSFICLAGLLQTLPGISLAGTESGFYLGGGLGDASIEATGFNESASSHKVFGGYNIGFIPLVDFAIEASHVNFGSQSAGTNKIEVKGINAFGLAGLSFGPFGVFAKAGMIDWDVDSNFSSGSNSGTDPAYGIGARLALGSFAIRAEYEIYDLDAIDVEMISISALYTF